jgi:hypothetical protein
VEASQHLEGEGSPWVLHGPREKPGLHELHMLVFFRVIGTLAEADASGMDSVGLDDSEFERSARIGAWLPIVTECK